MIQKFVEYLTSEKRLSKHTSNAYSSDLQQFDQFLNQEFPSKSIENTTFSEIRSWVAYLADKNLDNRSINRKLATLKSFFKFLLKKEIVELDPTLKLKSLKVERKLHNFVKESEMNMVLETEMYSADFEGIRDKLVIELLYGTGIRLAELIAISENDIDLYQKIIKVTGKRNKQRVVPIHNTLATLISHYLSLKNNKFADNHLILNNLGKKSYPMFIQRITQKYLNPNTNLKKKSPHVLRHTFATHLLNEGADLNAIKDLLGHSSLAATQVYTHNSIKKLKDIHLQAHPKA